MIGISVYTLAFGIKRARDFEIYKQPEIDTKIYTVWHIETFEGGGKSRISYLNKIARKLESENAGVLFAVKQIDADKLESLLQNQTPDICSFGFGIGKTLLPYLKSLSNVYNVRDELVASGSYNNNVYALAYIVSGYSLIEQETNSDNFLCGTSTYIHPEIIYNNLNKTPNKTQSQYEAYKEFANSKNSSLLGTARDVFRVNNLNKTGRKNATFTPIDSYTDLIQYVGLLTQDEMTKAFLEQTVNNENQMSLSTYSLFSSTYSNLYSEGIYNDMESAILRAKIPCVFDD